MGWNLLVGAIRETVTGPRSHKHLVAVSALNERTQRVLAWSADDVRRGENQGVAFYWGSPDAKPIVTIGHGPCPICGADVLQLAPADVDARLPECRIGDRGRVLVGIR